VSVAFAQIEFTEQQSNQGKSPMSIAPITLPTIDPAIVFAVAGVKANQISALTESAQANLESTSSIVDLSSLGQLLSAAAAIQAAPITAGSTAAQGTASGTASGTGFDAFLAATELFFNSYDNIQASSLDNAQNVLGSSFDDATLQALTDTVATGSGTSLLASLATLGIDYQAVSPLTGGSAQFTIEPTTLQSAWNANPTATSALLQQAFQTLSQVATTSVMDNLNLFATPTNTSLATGVPASQVNLGALAASIATLTPAQMEVFNAALQNLLGQQALSNTVAESAQVPTNETAAPLAATTVTTAENTVAVNQAALPAPAPAPAPATMLPPVPAAAAPQVATSTNNGASAANAVVPNQASLPNQVAVTTIATATASAAANATPATAAVNAPAQSTAPTATQPISVQQAAEATQAAEAAQAVLLQAEIELAAADVLAEAADAANQAHVLAEQANLNLAQNAAANNAATTVPTAASATATAEAMAVATAASNAAPAATVETAAVSTTAEAPTAEAAPPPEVVVAPFPSPLDPSIAVAVASYRINEIVSADKTNIEEEQPPELVADIAEVVRVRPVDFNTHAGPNDGQGGQQAKHAAPATKAVIAAELAEYAAVAAPGHGTVDVEA
jgi:hypothetical protein